MRAVRDFWELYDICKSVTFEDFFEDIRQIDYLYMNAVTEGQKRRAPKTKTPPKRPARR